MFSTLENALEDKDPWAYCNFDYYGGNVGFPRDCGPYKDMAEGISNQWNTFKSSGSDAYGSRLEYQFQLVAVDDKYWSSDAHFSEWVQDMFNGPTMTKFHLDTVK